MAEQTNRKISRLQKAIISMLFFLTVLSIGLFVMLLTGKMVLPI